MARVDWRHNHEQLRLPAVFCPGYNSFNPNENIRVEALLDTGATSSGLRLDIAEKLQLRQKGSRRINTANGMIFAPQFIVRVGFIAGDYTDYAFDLDLQQPYLIERELPIFGLQNGFPHEALIGMDILGRGDLSISRSGQARFDFE